MDLDTERESNENKKTTLSQSIKRHKNQNRSLRACCQIRELPGEDAIQGYSSERFVGQRKRWIEDITERTGLKMNEAVRLAEDRQQWRLCSQQDDITRQRY